MKLIELKLRNFKGIKELTIRPDGQDLNIYGENGSGKTTIFDSFMWLLFDKDSANSSNFNVKTLDALGNPVHMLEHEVSAVIEHASQRIELQKILKEKWTKKRGQAESELTGHTTEYFINGVPKKQKEYKDYLAEIIDEDTFRVLTNPLYFNKIMDWKKRREIAMSLCGEMSDEDIIRANDKLSSLRDLLEYKTIEDLKAETGAGRRKLNDEIKSIPYRIDELTRECIEEIDTAAVTAEKRGLEDKLKELNSAEGTDYTLQIRRIESDLQILDNRIKELEQNMTRDIRTKINAAMEKDSELKSRYYTVKGEFEKTDATISKFEEQKKTIQLEILELREKFTEISATKYIEGSNICPTCGQELPQDEIQKHIAEFEECKSRQLQEINQKGKDKKQTLEHLTKEIERLQSVSNKHKTEATHLHADMLQVANEVKALEEQLKAADVTSLDEYKSIQEEAATKKSEIQNIKELSKKEDNSEQTKELQMQIDALSKKLAQSDLATSNAKRVEELKSRERELANMIADLEKIEFMCDQYVITKSNMLEDKLNIKFKLVKFKLFDVQVNGGISETFVATVGGVPFDDLNNAMKINAGLDIINTLTEYYNFEAPIFIDNRESVNKIAEIKSQIINLVVTKDAKLKIEIAENREVA